MFFVMSLSCLLTCYLQISLASKGDNSNFEKLQIILVEIPSPCIFMQSEQKCKLNLIVLIQHNAMKNKKTFEELQCTCAWTADYTLQGCGVTVVLTAHAFFFLHQCMTKTSTMSE